jgi:hypothetical protein
MLPTAAENRQVFVRLSVCEEQEQARFSCMLALSRMGEYARFWN